MKKYLLIVLAASLLALIISNVQCGGGGGSSGSSGNNSDNSYRFTGRLDGSTATFASTRQMNFLDRFCEIFSPLKAYAAGASTITDIIAVCSDQTIVFATHTGNDFSLNLPRDKTYVIVLLNGTNIVGLYKPDIATDLDCVPVTNNISSIDVGSLTLDTLSDTFTAAISSTDLFNALSLSATVAASLGIADDGMLRLSSLDVDGNGTLDTLENKYYSLKISYEFNTTATFSSLIGSFSDPSETNFKWYFYIFYGTPDITTLDWVTATLHTPVDICSTNYTTPTANSVVSGGRNLNFAWNPGGAMTPETPPSGDYTITVTGATPITFTWYNIKSQVIDNSTLYNIYIPSIKLISSTGQVTSLEWTWWKNTPGGWVTPSTEELNAVISAQNVVYFLSDKVFAAGTDNNGSIGLTSTGSVAIAPQAFVPGALRITYVNKAGYDIGFEWRDP